MFLPETLLSIVQCQGLESVCLTKSAIPDHDLLPAVECQCALGCTCKPGSAHFSHPHAPDFFFFKFQVIDPMIDGPRNPV